MTRAALTALAVTGATLGFTAAPTTVTPVSADTQDFSYDSWHVEYQLGVDDEGRARARVTETLVPRFPDHDQNRGIVRGIPIDYQGTSTEPRNFAVRDADGTAVPFELEEDSTFVAVLVGDESFVHGVQTYVISYTLNDVILARDDGAADEFYWDIMDYEHAQPVAAFSADISFDTTLAARLTGNMRCYSGSAGSSQTENSCQLTARDDIVSVLPTELSGKEGATVAIGLEPGSVTQPPARLPDPTLDFGPAVGGGVALSVATVALILMGRLRRTRKIFRGTVVPQYEAPAGLPPLIAAPILGISRSPVPAEILHLAVHGAIRIEEGPASRGLLGPKTPPPAIRLLDLKPPLDTIDHQALRSLFPTQTLGSVFVVPRQSESFAAQMRKLQSDGRKAVRDRDYLEKAHSPVGRTLGLIALLFAIGNAGFSLYATLMRTSVAPSIGLAISIIVAILAIIAIMPHTVHTPRGAEAREHLEGLRLFIEVAEADRMRMLQSYLGAERREDSTLTDSTEQAIEVLHLYERLLPYAVLFGLEKQWSKVLETQYAAQGANYAPAWYPLAAAYGLSNMGSTISQFTSTLSSSASYSSSSSGGSTGGGFSGGGGGGGFSGGR